MAKDKDMPVVGSSVDIPVTQEAENRRAAEREESRETLRGEKSRVRLERPRHQKGEEYSEGLARAEDARVQRANTQRAVAVHHYLGEQAREEGHYPGEIVALHQSAGQEAMLGKGGAHEALPEDIDLTVIRAYPKGMSSRYDPNEA